MEERRPYWNMEMETRQNTPEMKEIQWEKLKKKVQQLYDTAPFWKTRFDKAGARPEAIKTWDDYSKRIPILTKEGFREFAAECDFDMEKILEGWMGEASKRLLCIASRPAQRENRSPIPWTKRIWPSGPSSRPGRSGGVGSTPGTGSCMPLA